MGLEAKKMDLVQKLLNIKRESVLKKVEKVLEEEVVVAYSVTGEPLTKSEYISEVKEAEKEIEDGEYLTHEQVLAETKKW